MPIPDEILRGLGRIAVNFQSLELHISFLTGGLIGPEQIVGQMVTTQLSFGKLCILSDSLFTFRFGKTDIGPKFKELISKALILEEKRNQLFHSAYGSDDEGKDVSRIKMSLKRQKGLSHSGPIVTADEINNVADEMAVVAKSIIGIISELHKRGLTKNPHDA